MRSYFLFFIILTLTSWTYAQGPGSIDNIQVSQRTGEEERVVDVSFTISGGDYYAIKLGIKFNQGDDFTPIQADEIIGLDPDDILDTHLDETIMGAIIVEAGEVELTWDGRESYAEIDAAAARIEITATRGLKDIDGNFYKSVLIGDQEWMAENLRVTRYNNEDDIPQGLSNQDWQNTEGGAYTIYDHSALNTDGINTPEEMVAAYGKLYNWYAVDDNRGVCPEGWSVPSDDDWSQLVDYVVAQGYPNESANPNGVGNALKSCRQVGHLDGGDCDTSEHPRWHSDDTHHGFDEFGFSALPGGNRLSNGSFVWVGLYGTWWSATESSGSDAWSRFMFSYYGFVFRNSSIKTDGYSVRCIKD